MSDVGRYRKLFPRIWRHPGFRGLSQADQRLTLYLLTGPQTNRIGVFHFSLATAAEDLGVSLDTLRKGLSNVTMTFGWMFDAQASCFYIPSWWRWNAPENRNVIAGNLKDLNEVPPCGLIDAFARNLRWLPPTSHETFVECLSIRLGERPPTQDQDQYQEQKQEQEPALRAEAGYEKLTDTALQIAKLTVKTHKGLSIDELVDHFYHYSRSANGSAFNLKRADVVVALNTALAEDRGAA